MKAFIIGIAGGSASGKSSFASLLKEKLESIGITAEVVSMDSYFLPIENLATVPSPIDPEKSYKDFNHPSSFDLNALNRDIHDISESGKCKVLIAEGLLTLWDKRLLSQFDLKVFIDCRHDERIVRRLRRNMEWGLSFDEISDAYLDLVRFRHDEFVEPTKCQADIILNGSGDFRKAAELIAVYAESKINR